MNEILSILPRRPDDAFDGFCASLKMTDQKDILDKYFKTTPKREQINGVDPGKINFKNFLGQLYAHFKKLGLKTEIKY